MDLKYKVLNDQIKPEELRIGNLVWVPSTSQVGEITVIHKHIGVVVNDSLRSLGFHEIKPILLTYNLMDFVGYKRDNDGVLKFGNCLYFLGSRLQIALKTAPIINIDCDYLHQLQNAHFLLFKEHIITDRNDIKNIK